MNSFMGWRGWKRSSADAECGSKLTIDSYERMLAGGFLRSEKMTRVMRVCIVCTQIPFFGRGRRCRGEFFGIRACLTLLLRAFSAPAAAPGRLLPKHALKLLLLC
jgi:hypothetical protein